MRWFRKSYDIQALARSSDEALMGSELVSRRLDPLHHAAIANDAKLVRVLLKLEAPSEAPRPKFLHPGVEAVAKLR